MENGKRSADVTQAGVLFDKMEVNLSITVVVLSLVCSLCSAQVYYQPEQVHIAYGEVPSEMIITWVTRDDTSHSLVEYGLRKTLNTPLNLRAEGSSHMFVDGGSEKRTMFVHKVVLKNLLPGQIYKYHVGSNYGWSSIFFFRAMRTDLRWSPKFLVYGDMGNVNAQSLPRVQEEILAGNVDFIIHSGDFAYNMDTYNARTGDEFMRQIEAIAAYVPYMTCVGNHEQAYNFSNYKNRFTMPSAGGDGQSMWFSFNAGPIHFISWASELYYFDNYGTDQIFNQMKWLEKDLQEANSRVNRTLRPWIISYTHRPMYCSNSNDGQHCTNVINTVRAGDMSKNWTSPESLLYKYGVDLQIGAHEHSYERMWPVFNRTVCNGSLAEPYTNPGAPVHLVTGSAGCQEGIDPFLHVPLPWSAARMDDYGYNRILVQNSTHLHMVYVSDDQNGKAVDEMNLIKNFHGAGLYTCHGH